MCPAGPLKMKNKPHSSDISSEQITEDVSAQIQSTGRDIEDLFNRCKNDNLREGVCYVNSQLRVVFWNRAAEDITGIRSTAMLDQNWSAQHVDLKDRYGEGISEQKCPVRRSVQSGEPQILASSVTGRGGRKIAIDLHAIPVYDHEGQIYGAVILFHDQSAQVELEQQVLTLYAHATRDQMTGVANRTHFERTLDARISEFNQNGSPSSLIVTDIDFFKTINDNFNHSIGDKALISFAKLLEQNTRTEDIVARYGGEEFVIICPNCTIMEAANRAEEIRQLLEITPHPMLNGKCMTASFGVSEIQPNDTATTVFVKADQALLNAKETGRNKVVKYSEECEKKPQEEVKPEVDLTAQIQWRKLAGKIVLSEEFATSSPIDIVQEKIKGFVVDFNGEVMKCAEGYVQIKIERLPGEVKRFGERTAQLLIDVEVARSKNLHAENSTIVRTTIRPGRMRDRRHKGLQSRAEMIAQNLRSFLMVSRKSETLNTVKPDHDHSGRYGL